MSLVLQIIKCAFSKQSRTLPELAQKSQPAHCQSAGRDIFGWLALLWVGRDLETEEEIRMLFYVVLTLRNRPCINIFMSQAREKCRSGSPSIRSQSLCRSCMGQASHSWIWVLLLCKAAAVVKACFRVSITSST